MNGITVGVGVGDGNTVGVELGVGEATGVGVAVGDAVGFGTEFATPLFQMSFLPLFMQVNFLPPAVAVAPAFLQMSPDLMAAMALSGAMRMEAEIMTRSIFFMVLCTPMKQLWQG